MWRSSLCIVASLCLGNVTSVVVCPSKMAVGETHYCFSSSQVARLELISSNTVVATATGVPGNQHLYSLVVPNLTPGNYSVQEPTDAAAHATVQLVAKGATLLLEADKALYKPGQVVRLRAVALTTADLRPAQRNVTLEVMSPEGFKLIRITNATDDFGVAEFTFPIAKEPLLGKHLAQVTIPGAGAGAQAQASFTVDEYVLPRFEVSVTVDQTQLLLGSSAPSSQRITGKVFANFTFGEPVRGGRCSVVVWAPLMRWETRSSQDSKSGEHRALATVDALVLDDTGRVSFETMVPSDSMNAGYPLMIEASVVFSATGEKQSGTQQLPVRYQGSDLQVAMMLSDGLEVFRPGLPVRVSLQMSRPGGEAVTQQDLSASGELVLVAQGTTVSYQKRPDAVRISLAASSFDSTGAQVVEIPMTKEDVSCCDPTASRRTWKEHEEACGCCVTYMSFYVERKLPGDTYFQRIYSAPESKSASACAGRAYSPSGEFLSMDAPTQGSDGRWSATLRSTRQPTTPTVIQYMITQAASLKAAGDATVTFSSTGSFWEGQMVMELPSMSGDLHLIAMHQDANLPTLAASAKFSRPLEMPFNFTCNFSKQEAVPGEELQVHVQASTTTGPVRAFMASLDRSAQLLGPRDAVSQSSILAALTATSDAKAATPVAGKVWRHCPRGDDMMIVAELREDELQVVRSVSDGGSDDAVYGEPLGANCPRPLYDGTACSGGGGGGMIDDMVMPMAEMAVAGPAVDANERDTATADVAPAGETTSGSPVRSFFPETWMWTKVDLQTGQGQTSQATGSLAVTAPDTITSWSLEGFAVTSQGIAAATSGSQLKVFKPFFVEMRLPYAAVRGEELELIIAVFNYADAGSLTAQLQVTLPAEIELVNGSASTELSVPQNQATRAFLRVRPKALGTWQILCTATAPTNGGGVRDAMRKPLLVKAEGIPMSITETFVVDLTGGSNFEQTKTLTLPTTSVSGSAKLSVTAVGDLLGPSLNGLERLLQIPTGCGEQNMITLAPNVYVAKYLLATSKLTPDLRERVVNNMVVGYGRQLTYRHEDGSFSAFGKSDESGSTWLTAFVLRVFVEVQETTLVFVDSSILKSAAEFLIGTQRSDGSFQRIGLVIHQEMLGGASGSDVALTAYVTSALAKAQTVLTLATLQPALVKAQTYLESQSSSDTYTALLRSHALLLAGLWSQDQAATEVLASSTLSGSYRFWTQPTETSSDRMGGREKTLDIEMTGYGLLALTSASRLGEAFQAVRWLLERRSASGGFSSTQDTVVALNALATYAIAAGQSVDVALQVKDGKHFSEALSITSENMDILQSLAPPVSTGELPLTVSGTGSGMALVMANLQYNVPESALTPCYTVEVQWFSAKTSGDATAVQACSSPVPNCGTPSTMAILSVGLFTGYAPAMSSLQALKDSKVLKRYELNDGRVDFYLEELPSGTNTCVQFKVAKEYQVWNVQPAASQVYEYYEPQSQGQSMVSFATQEMPPELTSLVGLRDEVSTTPEPTVAGMAIGFQVAVAFLVALPFHLFW